MAVETVIRSSFGQPGKRRALVLMGGGARAAYQAGVLAGLAQALRAGDRSGAANEAFPFEVIVGTSAGAINAAFLASRAGFGLAAFDQLAEYWAQIRTEHVFSLREVGGWSNWLGGTRVGAALRSMQAAKLHGALVDSAPLARTLEGGIGFASIQGNIAAGHLHALAVTAFSYTSGVHWTFCACPPSADDTLWSRPGRVATRTTLGPSHLLASSAIPFVFPAVPLVVEGREQYFGDGSMRQTSPLSPALKLGAERVLVIGVGQPVKQMSRLGASAAHAPGLGEVAANVIGSVFHDTLAADVEQTTRISQSLAQLPPDVASALGYRPVQVVSVHPQISFDRIAREQTEAMPKTVREALAPLLAEEGASAMTSYLLFEPAFTGALLDAGRSDAARHAPAFLDLLGATA